MTDSVTPLYPTADESSAATAPATPPAPKAHVVSGTIPKANPVNISIGFLGIQFAWALQMGQMSPLLESLGSVAWLTSLIWAAGPVTGVLVQPVVGTFSDNLKHKLGRRRPFLIIGAVMTAISLVLMPNSPNLLTAALLLWVLDASINLTQGPYRAMVPDVVEKKKQTSAYSMMSLTIGLGSVAAFYVASIIPSMTILSWEIPSMHLLFYLGAVVILLAIGWTVLTTHEPSTLPSTEWAQQMQQERKLSVWGTLMKTLRQTRVDIKSMPRQGLSLCVAHAFTWFGLMCLFVFFSVFVPKQIFGGLPGTVAYEEGVKWASLCYAMLNLVCFLFSPAINRLCNMTSKKAVHTVALLLMAVAYFSLFMAKTPMAAMIAMGVIGIGWATALSIPFALLTDHLPKGKEGVLMGTFNIFIAAPGVLCSFLVGPAIMALNGNDAWAFVFGGASILISAFLLQRVPEQKAIATA